MLPPFNFSFTEYTLRITFLLGLFLFIDPSLHYLEVTKQLKPLSHGVSIDLDGLLKRADSF